MDNDPGFWYDKVQIGSNFADHLHYNGVHYEDVRQCIGLFPNFEVVDNICPDCYCSGRCACHCSRCKGDKLCVARTADKDYPSGSSSASQQRFVLSDPLSHTPRPPGPVDKD